MRDTWVRGVNTCAAPIYEAPGDANGDGVYQVTVTATDAGGLTAARNVTLTLTNVNEAPVVSSAPTGTFRSEERRVGKGWRRREGAARETESLERCEPEGA